MKKSPKENPAISGQKRSKPAISGHENHSQQTAPEPEFPEPETRNLKPSQLKALVALLEERSITAAARKTGIGERTLRRWLQEDLDFQDELREMRREYLSHAATRLQAAASGSVQTLLDLLASKDHIEPGRAALVRTALDFAFRAGSYIDLAERLDEVEREARRQKEEGVSGQPQYMDDWAEDGAEA